MPNRSYNPELRRFLVEENRKMIQTLRDSIKGRPVKDKDYPQVAVACEYDVYRAYGHSRKCHGSVRREVQYEDPLLCALRSFGNPPETRKNPDGSVMFVGTCAEDFASNQVLEKYKADKGIFPGLKDMAFTQPIRARNYQWRKFCDVCKKIF